jgi:hypothetical protein
MGVATHGRNRRTVENEQLREDAAVQETATRDATRLIASECVPMHIG